MKINQGDFVLFELPSSNFKLIQVKQNENIDLGKYGSFSSSELIGKNYDWTFEINGEKLEIKDLELNDFGIFDFINFSN